jgi:hypothetical protein
MTMFQKAECPLTPADLQRIDRWEKFQKSEAYEFIKKLQSDRVALALARLASCPREELPEARAAWVEARAAQQVFEQEEQRCRELENLLRHS